MEDLFKNKPVVVVFILIVALAFYWFQYRPSSIRKECAQENRSVLGYLVEHQYDQCLKEHGLER